LEEQKEKPQTEKPAEPVEPEAPAAPSEEYDYVPPLFPGDSYEPDVSLNEEPLQPLTPMRRMVDAIGDMFKPQEPVFPDLDDFYGSTLEPPAPRVVRPRAPVAAVPVGGLCPKGYAGLCLVCGEAPCDYWKLRVLRQIQTEIQYGRQP